MKSTFNGVIRSILALFLFLSSIYYNLIPVKAIDTSQNVMDLVIDDANSALSSTYSIDHIDRFNQYGIAIISSESTLNDGSIIQKYGLMNSSGSILLNPIYDEIIPFDSSNYFYLVSLNQYNESYDYNYQLQGLYSQRNGSQVLDVKYNYIPSFEGKKIIELGYTVNVDNQEQWYNDIYKFNVSNGSLSTLGAPSSITLSDYTNLYINRVSDSYYIVYASRYINNTWENVSWIIDPNGNLIATDAYTWINPVRIGSTDYIIVQNSVTNQNITVNDSGLFKIINNAGSISLSSVIEYGIYDYIWYDSNQENFVVSSYSNEIWINGIFDPITSDWLLGNDPNGRQTNEYSYWLDSSLMMKQTCEIVDTQYQCDSYLYAASDSTKTNLFGRDSNNNNITYESVYSPKDGILQLQNGSGLSTTSNLLVKRNGEYFKVFSSDITGYVWVDNENWINVSQYIGQVDNQSAYKSYTFDLNLISSTSSWTTLIASSALLTDSGYVWTSYNRYKYISRQVNDSTTIASLYDIQTKSFVVQNVNNLNFNEPYNDTLSGSYSVGGSNYGFTYRTDNGVVNKKTYNGVTYIEPFNTSGYALAHLANSTGLIDASGSGNYVISPTGVTSFQSYFDYDGTKDAVITKNSDDKYVYFYLENGTVTSFTDLALASKNGSNPALIKEGNNYSFVLDNVKSSTILTNATNVSTPSNGISLKSTSDGIYVIKLASNASSIIDNATDFIGNIITINSVRKFAYLNSSNEVAYLELPTSVTSLNPTGFAQYNYNLYSYDYTINSINQIGYLFFDARNNQLIDLGSSQLRNLSSDWVSYANTTTNLKGILNTNGLVNVFETSTNIYSYYFDGNYINKSYSNGSSSISTLLDLNGNYLLVDGSSNPVYYDQLNVQGNIIYYSSGSTQNTAIITNDGLDIYLNTYANLIQGTTLIELSRPVSGQTYSERSLVNTSGDIIFGFNTAAPYLSFEINTEYNVILPYILNGTDSNGHHTFIKPGIYNFDGTLFSDLRGFSFDGSIKNGQLTIMKPTNYRRLLTFNDSYEDVSLYNKYDFSTGSFVYSDDYYYKFNQDGYTYIYSLGDLEHAAPYNSSQGGDSFIKKVNGVWDTGHQYVFETTVGVMDSNGNTIFPPNSFDYVHYENGYFIVYRSSIINGNYYNERGLFDSFGEPVACATRTSTSINLECSEVFFDKKSNQYVLRYSRTIENPSNDVNNPNINMQMTAFYDLSSNTLIEPGYVEINLETLSRDGAVTVPVYGNYVDENTDNDNFESSSWSNMKYGILKEDRTYLLNPVYDYIDQYDGNGNAVYVLGERLGLVNQKTGIILDCNYDSLSSTKTIPVRSLTPIFDERGLIKTSIGHSVGLADLSGPLFDDASYQYAYYKDGAFYLKKLNQDWIIINDEDITDAQMHGDAWDQYLINNASTIQTFSLDLDVDVSSVSKITINNADYFIASYSVYDSVFKTSYDYYGVLNSDGSIYLDFDYSLISFNTSETTWNLEIYNSLYVTYQKAVMDMGKNFIVPFNNKYDSVSEYVDGYAIGTSGTAPEVQQTSYNPFIQILRSFFLPVSATTNDEFVLEILDENGNVVGDLSDRYESVVLLGQVDGVVKALVKQNGEYFIATLTSVPFTGEVITAVEIDQPSLNLTLGATSRLFAEVFPLTSTQPKTVSWASSNPDVVSVDGKGNIKALSLGTATITLKVNQFTATSVVTVTSSSTSSSSSSSSTTYTSTVTVASQNSLPSTKQVSQINQLKNFLSSTETLTNTQVKTLIANSLEADANFVSILTIDEKQALETQVLKVYQDQINLIQPEDIPFTVTGLINLLNLDDLVNGKDIELQFSISNVLDEADQGLVDSYISEHQLDAQLMYPLNITITQISSLGETQISNVNGEVELTFALPSNFDGVGPLQVIKIHEGVVEILDVTINENHTFSFITSEFSSFTLVQKEMLSQITEPVQDQAATVTRKHLSNIVYYLFAGLLLAVGAFLVYRRKANA